VFAALDPATEAGDTLGSVVALGCGVLIAWTRSTYFSENNQTLTWYTLVASYDGTAPGSAIHHNALDVQSKVSGGIEVAAGAGGAGALVVDEFGGRFLPLDANGADRGPVQTLADGFGYSLAGGPTSFSYLVATGGQGDTPTRLVTIDPTGAPLSSRDLGDPGGRALWSRVVRSDGSFLLDTFFEDSVTTVYTDWLQGYDAQGNALAPPVATGANTAPVLLAATEKGALSSWWFSAPTFVPVDSTGAATGPAQTAQFTQAPYGQDVASMPNGDVLVALLGEDQSTTPSPWTIAVQERAPDGSARGDLSPFTGPPDQFQPGDVAIVAAPDSGHALIVYVNQGIHTQPIECAD
jgi:hypothetical protein